MAATGIRRKIDDLGRVVIPAGIRRSLDMREGDAIEVSVDGDRVVLAKPTDRCVFCGAEDGPLHAVRNKCVCRPCLAAVGVLDDSLRQPAGDDDPAGGHAAGGLADARDPRRLPSWGAPARGPARHLAPDEAPRALRPSPGASAGAGRAGHGDPSGRDADPAHGPDEDHGVPTHQADEPETRPPYDPESTTAW